MDYCSRALSLGEYSSRTPRSSGSEKVLSAAYFYGRLLGKEFYLRVNIHPTLFAALLSRRMELQVQGGGPRWAFQGSRAPHGSTPISTRGDVRRCIREVIEVVYPQFFEKLGEKFKKYEHFNSYTGNLLSFNAF